MTVPSDPQTVTVRLRDDAPNDLGYTFGFPGQGLVRLDRAVPPDDRTVLTVAEFVERFCEPTP